MSPHSSAPDQTGQDRTIHQPIRPARHPGRWVAIAFVVLLVAMFVNTLITNPRFEWPVVAQYFTSGTILQGVQRSLELTAIAM